MLRSLRRSLAPLLVLCGALTLGQSVVAQSNTIQGLDLQLAFMDDIDARGRTGTYPNGMNGVAIATTICNKGNVEVDWFAAMDPRHPMIAFLVARETDGRLVQISNRSYLKHGFFALTSSQCDSCQPPGGQSGTRLGIGCSDTYSVFNNGDNYWLGPPDEIDPWLGTWEPECSLFDAGLFPTGGPEDCDGVRSFTFSQAGSLGPVGNRINISDADLNVADSSFYYQGYYVVLGEGEKQRTDNMATRQMSATWTGSSWNLNDFGPLKNDTILVQWDGATVSSAANRDLDGRVYVAVKTSGPVDGMYRYEYAIHNRDNFQAVGGFRLPICDGARVEGLGFRDIDDDPANDWTATVQDGEIVFEAPDGNPLHWNTFYNVWFETDAAPADGAMTLDQYEQVVGQPSFPVDTTVPGTVHNVYLGDGCGSPSTPALYSNDRATIGNSSFTLETTGNVAGSPNALFLSELEGSLPLPGGCTLWLGGALGSDIYPVSSGTADGDGKVVYSVPVPNEMALEGLRVSAQAVGVNPSGGAAYGLVDLSNGLLVRVGDMLNDCP